MNFSIVIPNYNGEAFLNDCLKSILNALKYSPSTKIEIIIVDNGSTDNSKNIIKNNLEIVDCKLEIVFLQKNQGFGYAVNIGVKKAKYEYVVVMNNDLTIDKYWFKNISKAIKENPLYACYYGLVLNKNGTKIESEGFQYFMSGKAININNNHPYFGNCLLEIGNSEIWGAPASLIIYKKEIYDKLKGFDASFFAYIEDVDLAYRLAKNNYKTLYIPSAISYHLGGGTSSKMGYLREWLSFRNWIKLINKNYTLSQKIIYFIPIIGQRLRNLKYLLVKLLKATLRGENKSKL